MTAPRANLALLPTGIPESDIPISYSQPISHMSPAGYGERFETLLRLAPMFLDEVTDLVAELAEPYHRNTAKVLQDRFRILRIICKDLELEYIAAAARAMEVYFELLWVGTIELKASHWILFKQSNALFNALFEKVARWQTDSLCSGEANAVVQLVFEYEPLAGQLLDA